MLLARNFTGDLPVPDIRNVSTRGFLADNATLATAGQTIQRSPGVGWLGSGWTGSVAQAVEARAEVRPIPGTTPITAKWFLSMAIDGGSFVDLLDVNQAGNSHVPGSFTPDGGLVFSTSGGVTATAYQQILTSSTVLATNVPTGGTVDWRVNGTSKMSLGSDGVFRPDSISAILGTASITTNNLSAVVGSTLAGTTNLTGRARWSTSGSVTAANYEMLLSGTTKLTENVPTGSTYDWRVNDVSVMTLNGSGDLHVTGDGTFDGGSGLSVTNGDVIVGVSQDGASIFASFVRPSTGLLFDTAQGITLTNSDYTIRRDTSGTNKLQNNVPTGASYRWSVNGVDKMTLDSSGNLVVSGTVTGSGGGGFTLENGSTPVSPTRTKLKVDGTILLFADDGVDATVLTGPGFALKGAVTPGTYQTPASITLNSSGCATAITAGIIAQTATSVSVTQGAGSGTTPQGFLFTGGAHTTMPTAAEQTEVYWNLGQTKQFTGGSTIATQRAIRVDAPTYSATSAQTLTNAYTMAIMDGPHAGSSTTIGNSSGLYVSTTGAAGTGAGNAFELVLDRAVGSAILHKQLIFRRNGSEKGSIGLDASDNLNVVWANALHLFSSTVTLDNGGIVTNAQSNFNGLNVTQSQQPDVDGTRDLGSNTPKGYNNVFGRTFKYAGTSTQMAFGDDTAKNVVFSTTDGTLFTLKKAQTTLAVQQYTYTHGVQTSGTPVPYLQTGAAHTTLTAAEFHNQRFDNSATQTMVGTTGTITLMRSCRHDAPTYAFSTTTHTITNATNGWWNAPIKGTNATIARTAAGWFESSGSEAATVINEVILNRTGTQSNSTNRIALELQAATADVGGLGIFKNASAQHVVGLYDANGIGFGVFSSNNIVYSNTWPVSAGSLSIGISGQEWSKLWTQKIGNSSIAGGLTLEVGGVIETQTVSTSGTPLSGLKITAGAHTSVTATAEAIDYDFGSSTARTVSWLNTGAPSNVTTQRCAVFRQTTLNFATNTGSPTFTTAATVAIVGAPIAGANALITNAYSLWVQAGTTRLDGPLSVGGGSQPITSGALTATGNVTLGNNASTIMIGTGSSETLAFFGAAGVIRQSVGATVTAGTFASGTTVATFAGTVYATDSATIQNDLMVLAEGLANLQHRLKDYGLVVT